MQLRFMNPNYHVILIHYPLGVFVLGVLLELGSLFLWRRSSVRIAARWMILLGALLSLPAATSGIFAMYDVTHQQGKNPIERMFFLSRHAWLMGTACVLAVAFAVTGLGMSNHGRKRLRLPLLLGFFVVCNLMVVGAWYGGETIYQQGTAVSFIKYKGVQSDDAPVGLAAEPKAVLQMPETPETSLKVKETRYGVAVNYFLGGELQIHIITAGLAFAAAAGALGLSIRRMTTLRAAEREDLAAVEEAEAVDGNSPRRGTDDVSVMRTLNPDALLDPEESKLPVARFWFLATLMVIVTAVLGYWSIQFSDAASLEGWRVFWKSVQANANIRHFAHLVLGIAMIAVTLIFLLLAFWLPRRPLPLLFFGTLLVLLVAAQVWVGVLLTFKRNVESTNYRSLLHYDWKDKAAE